MDFLLEALTNWLKEMLVGGIMSNLSGMFDSVNQQVADISVQVGQTPQGWNGSIFSMIENLSNSIMVPIAGVILAIVMTVDLIQMIADKNNLHDVDTWMIFKWVFKSAAAILIVTNTWNIVMGVFDMAQSVVAQAAGIINSDASIDISSVMTDLEPRLMEMDLGPLFGLWFQSLFIGITMWALYICIFIVIYGRMIEIYLVTSLSGAFLPFVALVLVDTLGVSWAFSILGGLAFLLFPLCWRIIRNTPEDIGLTVDGVAANPFAAAREEEKVIPMNWRELVASRQMWIIGVSFGIGLMAVGGVLSQLKPRFVDTGMSSYVAMGFMCLTALLGAVGKYAWGWVCDRTTPLFATKLLFLCNALSLACIFLPHTLFNVILFVVGYGVCMGGIWTVFPSVVAYLYGKKQFPHVYKYISLFVAVKSLGYAAVGLSHSLTGNYNMAYMGMVILLLAAFAATSTIREHEAAEGNVFSTCN